MSFISYKFAMRTFLFLILVGISRKIKTQKNNRRNLLMKKLMKNVAVLALAAAVAVGSVTGVSAAVKSPTSS